MTSQKQVIKLDKLLDQIRRADIRQSKAQMEIANILTAIRSHSLWEPEGYESFGAMVTGELEFSLGTATAYISLHKNYVRLKYTEDEFLKLLQHFSWRKVNRAIAHSTRKMGIRAINNYYDAVDETDNQFNFNLHDRNVAEDFERILSNYGMQHHEGGMRSGMTTALLALLDDFVRLKSGQPLQLALRDKGATSNKNASAVLH